MIARQPTTNPFRTSAPAGTRTFFFVSASGNVRHPFSAVAATAAEALADVQASNPRIEDFVPA